MDGTKWDKTKLKEGTRLEAKFTDEIRLELWMRPEFGLDQGDGGWVKRSIESKTAFFSFSPFLLVTTV